MTAPMPLRFYNPVKDLCAKINLDYETVIGTGLSPSMRSAYVNADIEKPLNLIKQDDKKRVKHKIEFLNKKYGGTDLKTGTGEGETEDKGRIRYDAGVTVESLLPNDSEVDKQTPIRHGMENSKPIPYTRADMLWIPGTGVIPRNEIGGSYKPRKGSC
jgi:hypothetical protein